MTETRRIPMHRRTCTVAPGRIDISPSRNSIVWPLVGLMVGGLCFVAIIFGLGTLPFLLVILLLLVGVVIVPLSGMGLVYSVVGANVIVDQEKQSAVWQQGLLGMGVGTQEVVPFWKIDRIIVEETTSERQQGQPQDLAQYEITLVKTNGRHLKVGVVTVPRALAKEGLAQAREVAQAIGDMAGRPVQAPGRRRRRATAQT